MRALINAWVIIASLYATVAFGGNTIAGAATAISVNDSGAVDGCSLVYDIVHRDQTTVRSHAGSIGVFYDPVIGMWASVKSVATFNQPIGERPILVPLRSAWLYVPRELALVAPYFNGRPHYVTAFAPALLYQVDLRDALNTMFAIARGTKVTIGVEYDIPHVGNVSQIAVELKLHKDEVIKLTNCIDELVIVWPMSQTK